MPESAKSISRSDTPSPEKLDAVVRRWWAALEDRRGDRAELRRCRTPEAVAFHPSYHRLLNDLRRAGLKIPAEVVAVIAGVLSQVETDDRSGTFAAGMAAPQNGKARVSGLRFRRLLAIDDLSEFYTALIRMIHLLGGTAPIRDLAESIRWWNDRTKKRWALDYYAMAPNED